MADDIEARVRVVEEELNLLKNQVQQTLLDVREHILDLTNPFQGNTIRNEIRAPESAAATMMAPPPEPAVMAPEPAPPPPPSATVEPPAPKPAPPPMPAPVAGMRSEPEDFNLDLGGSLGRFDLGDDDVFGSLNGFDDEASEDDFGSEDGFEDSAYDYAEPEEEVEPQDMRAAKAKGLRGRNTRTAAERAGAEQPAPPIPALSDYPEMDLVTLVGVVRWVDQAVQRLGQQRVDAILDIWEMNGRVSAGLRSMIDRMCALTNEDADRRVPLRDLVAMMIQMDAVLDKEQSENTRLLAMLFDDGHDPLASLGLR